MAGGRSAGRAGRRFTGVVEEVGVGEEDAAEQRGSTEADDWLWRPRREEPKGEEGGGCALVSSCKNSY